MDAEPRTLLPRSNAALHNGGWETTYAYKYMKIGRNEDRGEARNSLCLRDIAVFLNLEALLAALAR